MKHGCFPLRSVRLLVFFCGVFLLYANPAKADPIHSLSDFLNNDSTETNTGLFRVVDGEADHMINQSELNSLKVIGSLSLTSLFIFLNDSHYDIASFSYEHRSNVAELGLDSGASESLMNFIGASAF